MCILTYYAKNTFPHSLFPCLPPFFLSFNGAEDQTQGLTHARQVLYYWAISPFLHVSFLEKQIAHVIRINIYAFEPKHREELWSEI
jgi:hypothetical protein